MDAAIVDVCCSKECSHLHIMLSGMCAVTKYSDMQGAVQRRISEIGAALYRIKSKYAYHREVRPKIVSQPRPSCGAVEYTMTRGLEFDENVPLVSDGS